MTKRILVTSIITLLCMMTLIRVEPAGSTAQQPVVTARQTSSGAPQSSTAAVPTPGQVEQITEQKPDVQPVPAHPTSAPAATPASDLTQKTAPNLQVQTEAVTSPAKTKQVKADSKTQPAVVTAPVATAATSQQLEMLGYINAARAQAGLSALVLDNRLCQGAYLKSQDMAVQGYFSHTSTTYGSPFDMMKSLGISYRSAAENIARNSSVSAAQQAFMNSNGHRANILNPAFNKTGLGFYQKGSDLFVTQWFTN